MTYYCERCLSEHESPDFVCTECEEVDEFGQAPADRSESARSFAETHMRRRSQEERARYRARYYGSEKDR